MTGGVHEITCRSTVWVTSFLLHRDLRKQLLLLVHLEIETGAYREVKALPRVTQPARTEILTLSRYKLETTLLAVKSQTRI